MPVTLREISDENRDAALAVRVAPEQEQFVGTVREALGIAEEIPEANAWYRAVYDGHQPVGFVMLSWNVTPRPPNIIGPWFLWKLIVDRDHQGRGYGAQIIRQVADIVRAEGATELLTSYMPGEGGPGGFYERVGFEATGEVDGDGEIILRLPLTA